MVCGGVFSIVLRQDHWQTDLAPYKGPPRAATDVSFVERRGFHDSKALITSISNSKPSSNQMTEASVDSLAVGIMSSPSANLGEQCAAT